MAEIVPRARASTSPRATCVGYLDSLPDGSLGGLIAIQVVEHLEPDYLMRALDVAYHKLRPGSRIVLETINPACWFAFFASYIRDLTHVRPLHPETLQYLLTASGFERATIEWRSPYPAAEKLQPVAPAAGRRVAGRERPARHDQRQRRAAERSAVHAHGLRGRGRQALRTGVAPCNSRFHALGV